VQQASLCGSFQDIIGKHIFHSQILLRESDSTFQRSEAQGKSPSSGKPIKPAENKAKPKKLVASKPTKSGKAKPKKI